MKYLMIFIFGINIFFQDNENQKIDVIIIALKTGNASEFIRFFDTKIDISLEEEAVSCNIDLAKSKLDDFFKKYPIKNFIKHHQGKTADGITYLIGNYLHSKGEFKLFLKIKKKNKNYLINHISISKH